MTGGGVPRWLPCPPMCNHFAQMLLLCGSAAAIENMYILGTTVNAKAVFSIVCRFKYMSQGSQNPILYLFI